MKKPLIQVLPALWLCLWSGSVFGQLTDQKTDKFQSGKKGDSVSGKVQRLDLTGLLDNRVPMPDANPPADTSPVKDMVKAALDVLSNEGLNSTVSHYSQVFGQIPKTKGSKETAPLTAADVKAGAKYLQDLLDHGAIKAKEGAAHAAGAWTPDVTNDQLVGGTVEIGGDIKGAKDAGRSHQFQKLFAQDQIADTTLHEAAHMLYSYFRFQRDAKEASTPDKIQEDFALHVFWTGLSPAGTCSPSCSAFHIRKAPCHGESDIDCYMYHLSDDGYGKSGNEDAARKIANELETSTSGTAYAKVLAPLVR